MADKEKQTEDKILDAATFIFEEKGMDGARMQEIADKAGINKSLLHYYYRTKEKLFKSVFNKLAKRMFKKFMFNLAEENLSFEDKIRLFTRSILPFCKRTPNFLYFF